MNSALKRAFLLALTLSLANVAGALTITNSVGVRIVKSDADTMSYGGAGKPFESLVEVGRAAITHMWFRKNSKGEDEYVFRVSVSRFDQAPQIVVKDQQITVPKSSMVFGRSAYANLEKLVSLKIVNSIDLGVTPDGTLYLENVFLTNKAVYSQQEVNAMFRSDDNGNIDQVHMLFFAQALPAEQRQEYMKAMEGALQEIRQTDPTIKDFSEVYVPFSDFAKLIGEAR